MPVIQLLASSRKAYLRLVRTVILASVLLILANFRVATPFPHSGGQWENLPHQGSSPPSVIAGTAPRSPLPARTPEMIEAQFVQARRDAATLAELANALNLELSRSNQNMMPAGAGVKAEKIEKLAKKIKKWARRN